MGTNLDEEPAGSVLCRFAFAFDRHSKSFSPVVTHIPRAVLQISVSLLFKSIRNFIWSLRDSDPGVSIVSAQRHDSDLKSIFTVQVTCCNFPQGPNFGVPLDPSYRLWCILLSWKSVFTTSHCIKLCETFSVLSHEVLSILHNTQKSCIHTKFTQFVLLC